jgi:nitrite reductase/ring-hydroxylating ferredoxin subunit
MTWHKLAMLTDVSEGVALETGIVGQPLALYKVDGKLYCTGNLCTHAEAYLSDGYLEGYVIECPLHGARFDIRDGRVLCAPATRDVASYPVRVEGEEVFVDLP